MIAGSRTSADATAETVIKARTSAAILCVDIGRF
jgi:hypothetical protein